MSHQSAARRVTTDPDSVDDSGATVLHVDMDAFFAAVELRRRPELRDRPMMVAGVGGRGVVLSATYEARAYGIRSAMPTAQAMARCPGIIVIPPDHSEYRAASHELMDLLGSITDLVEPVSVDEAFLDVSGCRRRLGRPGRIAMLLRSEISEKLGLSATVGVSATKFVAKLASTLAKPDGLLIVPRDEVSAFLRPLPVGALWGVGPKMAATLRSNGYATVSDIADAPIARLVGIVGAAAAHSMHRLAHGVDDRTVTPATAELSVGAERTFERDLTDDKEIRRTLLALAGAAARRLRQAGRSGRTVVLKVRFGDFATVTRSETLAQLVADDRLVYATAVRLWQRLDSGNRAVRLLGVRVENIAESGAGEQQLELGDDSARAAWHSAQEAVDVLRDRFGDAAPRPAALLPQPSADTPR